MAGSATSVWSQEQVLERPFKVCQVGCHCWCLTVCCVNVHEVEMENHQIDDITRLPYLYNAMVTQRNQEWAVVAKRLLSDTTPALFIVGALHTVGSGSFIEQLEANGFRFNFIV
jgi:uncharacterized protein YbaP (TraB family)